MLHFVVATDFSEVAENAVHYACQMAVDQGASLTVVHSFIVPVSFSDVPMPIVPVDEGQEIAEERVRRLLNRLKPLYPGLGIMSKIIYGDIVEGLQDEMAALKADLIFFGNSGTGNELLWLGSSALNALRHLDNLVVTIPKAQPYSKIEKICLACDLKNIASKFPFLKLEKLVQITGAQLHVLNVDYENRQFVPEETGEISSLHEHLKPLNPVYHNIENVQTDEGIRDFIEMNGMDWLIVMPHRHSFFEGLFHKSHTKEMVKMVSVPIAALHELS